MLSHKNLVIYSPFPHSRPLPRHVALLNHLVLHCSIAYIMILDPTLERKYSTTSWLFHSCYEYACSEPDVESLLHCGFFTGGRSRFTSGRPNHERSMSTGGLRWILVLFSCASGWRTVRSEACVASSSSMVRQGLGLDSKCELVVYDSSLCWPEKMVVTFSTMRRSDP